VLPAGLTESTTQVEEDVDGRAPRGAAGGSSSVRHQVLKTTSMVGP
jgi:hypothetical protein